MTVESDFSIHYERDKPTAKRVFTDLTVNDAISLASTLVGGATTAGFFQPSSHPIVPGIFVTSCDIAPHGELGNDDSTQYAVLTVNYGRLENDQKEDEEGDPVDLGEESIELSGQIIDLPKGAYTWGEGSKSGKKLGENDIKPIKILPELGYTLKLSNVTDLSLSTWNGLIGKTNSGTFKGFAAGTVLYMGLSSSRGVTTDGYDKWELTHKFQIQQSGWNKFWDGSQFSTVTPTVYSSGDFSVFEG